MTLDTAVALAELIDGQIKFLWTVIGLIALAQVAILRAALNATGPRWGAKIGAVFCALFVATSYFAGYAAANGLVTLLMEAGAVVATATEADRAELEGEIRTTLSTVEVFSGVQAGALLMAVVALAISVLMNRDLIGEVLNGDD